MAKGVYLRTERHRAIARKNFVLASRARKGKTYIELYGAERATRVKKALAISKIGEQNPAKRSEVRAKIGIAAKGRSSWLNGLSKEIDARVMEMSRARAGKRVGAAVYISEESKARRRAKTSATWVNHPELKERVFNKENNEKRRMSHIKALHEGRYSSKKDTNIERAIEARLQGAGLILGLDYFKQVPLPAHAPLYVVDFFIPAQHRVIEGYGCFWHKCPACGYDGPRSVDERRRRVLEGEGLVLEVVWGHEI